MNPTCCSSTRRSTATVVSCAPTCSRPDLKKYTSLRFRQDVVLVFMEAQDLESPLTLVSSDLHLELEGYPVEQDAVIEIPLLPPGSRGPARGFG